MFLYNDSIQHDDFCITESLFNARFPTLSLLPVIYDNGAFFIRCVQRKDGVLYRADKATQPSDITLVKKVLSFLAKQLEVSTHNLSQTRAKHINNLQSRYLITKENLATLNPDYIEIGFGSGRHILDIARNNPNKIVLGFEIHSPSIRQVLNAIALYHLENLFVCSFDARLGIQTIKPDSVSAMFLHFPVPWNKAKHRRVFSRQFLENSLEILKQNAKLHIRSDDYEYANDCIHEALQTNYTHFEVFKNRDIQIVSKYEARWSRMQKDMYDIYIFKNKKSQNAIKKSVPSFALPQEIALESICNKKVVQDKIFVSIGDLYRTKESTKVQKRVFQLAFGSCAMPFNTYVVAQNGNLSYFKEPLPIHTHIQAHTMLCHILQESCIN